MTDSRKRRVEIIEDLQSALEELQAISDDLEAKPQESQIDANKLLAAIVHELIDGQATGRNEQ